MKPAKYNQHGFTIIEIMICVAVVSVLAAIAIPIYQDYTNRSKVTEAAILMAGVKNPMTEYYGTWGVWPSLKTIGAKTRGTFVSSIKSVDETGSGGDIFIEALMKGPGPLENTQIRLIYGADENNWVCTTKGTSKPIPLEYIPPICR